MNNNSYFIISAEKFEDLVNISCPPVARATQANICIEYEGDCKECWKSWLKDGE